MKIERNDSERLTISDFPYIGIAFCLLFVLAGGFGAVRTFCEPVFKPLDFYFLCGFALVWLVVLLKYSKRCEFDFDWRRRQLNWSRVGLFDRERGDVPLGNVTEAYLQTRLASRGIPMYRLAVATKEGDIPMTDTYFFQRWGAEACEQACHLIDAAIEHKPDGAKEG
jgi:hypothetical protein